MNGLTRKKPSLRRARHGTKTRNIFFNYRKSISSVRVFERVCQTHRNDRETPKPMRRLHQVILLHIKLFDVYREMNPYG